jgi:hypothetical protein
VILLPCLRLIAWMIEQRSVCRRQEEAGCRDALFGDQKLSVRFGRVFVGRTLAPLGKTMYRAAPLLPRAGSAAIGQSFIWICKVEVSVSCSSRIHFWLSIVNKPKAHPRQKLADLCACCDIWGQCGTTGKFCLRSPAFLSVPSVLQHEG